MTNRNRGSKDGGWGRKHQRPRIRATGGEQSNEKADTTKLNGNDGKNSTSELAKMVAEVVM